MDKAQKELLDTYVRKRKIAIENGSIPYVFEATVLLKTNPEIFDFDKKLIKVADSSNNRIWNNTYMLMDQNGELHPREDGILYKFNSISDFKGGFTLADDNSGDG